MSRPALRMVLYVAILAVLAAGCGQPAGSPASPSAAAGVPTLTAAADTGCMTVRFEGDTTVGMVPIPDPPYFTLGAGPGDATMGNISGSIFSVVTGQAVSGSKQQGAQHFTLMHTFTADGNRGGFLTEDQAACAPAGQDAPGTSVCRVNNVMRLVDGWGVFAHPTGQLEDNGVITLTVNEQGVPSGSIHFAIHGHICGAGL